MRHLPSTLRCVRTPVSSGHSFKGCAKVFFLRRSVLYIPLGGRCFSADVNCVLSTGFRVCVRTPVFVRARLQSCRNGSRLDKALAAEGFSLSSHTDSKSPNILRSVEAGRKVQNRPLPNPFERFLLLSAKKLLDKYRIKEV